MNKKRLAIQKTLAKSKVCVVLPAYNEARFISKVLRSIQQLGFTSIVVDDGSQDTTSILSYGYTPYVLSHTINLGKGAAVRTGCEFAFNELSAQAIILMDADAQHSTDDLDGLYQMLKQKHEIVLGVRSLNSEMPKARKLANRLHSAIVKVLFGRYIPDIPSGFKGLTKSAYDILELTASDYAIEQEIAVKIAQKKLQFVTIPIKTIYHDLERGFHPLDSISLLLNLLRWRLQP
jgi:glycosyltransferase involved in cell wall biosynthesis